MREIVVAVILLAFALAGCLGGDDVEPEDEGVSEDAAMVYGDVLNSETLTALEDVRIRLIQDGETIHETHTREDGNYTINNVENGTYRLQAFHLQFEPVVERVSLEPGQRLEMNIMLDRLTDVVDRNPYSDGPYDFEGSYCGGANPPVFSPITPCQSMDDNHDMRTTEHPARGLRTVIVGLEWQPAGGPLGAEEFTLVVDNILGDRYEYNRVTGSSPLEIRIDESTIENEDRLFSNYDTEDDPKLALDFSVELPEGTAAYQQTFKIHWRLWYWEEAPSGATALPG